MKVVMQNMNQNESQFINLEDTVNQPEPSYEVNLEQPEPENIDDGIVVDLNKEMMINNNNVDFFANLAPELNDLELSRIANLLNDKIESDLESREQWESTAEKAIDLLALTIESLPTNSQDPVRVYSNAFKQNIIAAVANCTVELLPPNGPGKVLVKDNYDEENLIVAADGVELSLNKYLTVIDQSFYPDTEQAFMWYNLLGNCFKKVYIDPITNKPLSRYITPENMIINDKASDIESATLITERQVINSNTLIERKIKGLYRPIEIQPMDISVSDKQDKSLADKVLGISGFDNENEQMHDYDKTYEIYDCYCYLDIEGFEHLNEKGEETGLELPYVVSMCAHSNKILAIYRDWDLRDPLFKRKNRFYHYGLFPGLGFYYYGMVHVCGNDAVVVNSIEQQLLLTAQFSNFPAYFRTKGLKNETPTLDIQPGHAIELTGAATTNPNEMISMIPTKEPSQTLLALKNEIENGIRSYSSLLTQGIADLNPSAPVGTTLALIEQHMKIPNANIKRLFNVISNELKHLARLLLDTGFLPVDNQTFDMLEIQSVADPTMSSNIQRSLQAQFILQTAQSFPDLHDMKAVVERLYKSNKIPNIDELFAKQPQPVTLDPLNENLAMSKGTPVIANINQDHQSHITVHTQEYQTEAVKAQANPMKIEMLIAHIKEHEYLQTIVELSMQAGQELPYDPTQVAQNIELQNQIAQMEAQKVQEEMQKMQEQQGNNPQPIDPNMVMLKQVEMEDETSKRRAEVETLKAQIELFKVEQNTEIDRLKLEQSKEIELLKIEVESQRKEKQHLLEIEKLNIKLHELQQQLEEALAKQHIEVAKLDKEIN